MAEKHLDQKNTKKLNIFLTSMVEFYTHVWFHEEMKFLILWIEKQNHAYKTKQKVFLRSDFLLP